MADHWNDWIEGVIGFWLILSPWLLGFSDISLAKWSGIICGLILVLLNLWSLFGERVSEPKGQTNQ